MIYFGQRKKVFKYPNMEDCFNKSDSTITPIFVGIVFDSPENITIPQS